MIVPYDYQNLFLAIMRNYIATQSSITLQQLTTHFKKSAAAARVNKVQCLTRAQVIILKLYTKGVLKLVASALDYRSTEASGAHLPLVIQTN